MATVRDENVTKGAVGTLPFHCEELDKSSGWQDIQFTVQIHAGLQVTFCGYLLIPSCLKASSSSAADSSIDCAFLWIGVASPQLTDAGEVVYAPNSTFTGLSLAVSANRDPTTSKKALPFSKKIISDVPLLSADVAMVSSTTMNMEMDEYETRLCQRICHKFNLKQLLLHCSDDVLGVFQKQIMDEFRDNFEARLVTELRKYFVRP